MLIERLKIKNLLSFGPEGIDIKLGKLNVLIGANGSGKSNFIEAISVLKALPKDAGVVILEGGGIRDWLWLGSKQKHPIAAIEAVVNYVDIQLAQPVRHRIEFWGTGDQFTVHDECIEATLPAAGEKSIRTYYSHHNFRVEGPAGKPYLRLEEIDDRQSVLAQIKEPRQFGQITALGKAYSSIAIYRDWTMGPQNPARDAQKTDLWNGHVDSHYYNLALVLNRLKRHPPTKRRLIEMVQNVYPGLKDFEVQIEAGRAQLFLEEEHFSVSATRVSDGTLRYLYLLAILLDPEPPSLICIDEPEIGLHPDLVMTIAELLKEASSQLIITTHSDMLVDAMTDRPEDVIICEREDGQSQMCRLTRKALKEWLKSYSLGQLWHSGQIGGNRW